MPILVDSCQFCLKEFGVGIYRLCKPTEHLHTRNILKGGDDVMTEEELIILVEFIELMHQLSNER